MSGNWVVQNLQNALNTWNHPHFLQKHLLNLCMLLYILQHQSFLRNNEEGCLFLLQKNHSPVLHKHLMSGC